MRQDGHKISGVQTDVHLTHVEKAEDGDQVREGRLISKAVRSDNGGEYLPKG